MAMSRKQVVLDDLTLALAEKIGAQLGAPAGRRLSPALRHVVQLVAEQMGISLDPPAPTAPISPGGG